VITELADPVSVVFQAACNEAVEASMRPIRPRVLDRLADRCRNDSQVSTLLTATWDDAENSVPNLAKAPLRENLVGNKFIELIARDPRWKTVVLNAIVQERRWSDLWSRGHRLFSDRLLSFFEKLISPNHPVARLTTGALASVTAVLLALWIPPKAKSDVYDIVLQPVLKPFQSMYAVPFDLKPRMDTQTEMHLKVIVDDKGLTTLIRPIVSPNNLNLNLQQSTDVPLRITPQIQYPFDSLEKDSVLPSKSQGLGIRLIPTADLSGLPSGLWDPKSGLRVSVTQLDAPTDKPRNAEPISSKAGNETERPSRPLDKIEADLETLGGEFQPSKSNPQSTLVALQQNQNSIHSIVANHGRTTVIDATPNSVHSVLLQWVGEDTKLQFCNFTLRLGNIGADELNLFVTKQQCSSNISLVGQLPHSISLGPGVTQQIGPWILSVDEMRRRRIFQHAATLRFTWQPTNKVNGPGTEVTLKLP
jgi:hypothetical protein